MASNRRTVWSSRVVYAISALVAVAGLALPLSAEVSWRPLGEEFKVNDRTRLDQFRPSVATNADGRSFVVWSDAGQLKLYGRLLDASGQPLSGDLWINEQLFIPYARARVAAGREGQFTVTWSPFNGGLMIRRYDADGEPLSDPVLIRHEPGEYTADPDIAFDAAGNFFLAWVAWPEFSTLPFPILIQKFDAVGRPLTRAYRIDQGITFKEGPRLALDPETGGGVAVWTDMREADNPDIWARRFTSTGQPLKSEFLVDVGGNGEAIGAVPVFHAGGGFSVVWSDALYEAGILETVAQRFDAKGERAGSAVVLTEEGSDFYPPAIAPGPHGSVLVLWPGVDQPGLSRAVKGQLFDSSSWRPVSPLFQVNTYVRWDQTEPAVATDGRGNYVAVWSSGEQQFPMSPQPVEWHGQDGSSYGVFGQRFSFAAFPGPPAH